MLDDDSSSTDTCTRLVHKKPKYGTSKSHEYVVNADFFGWIIFETNTVLHLAS